MDKPDHSSKRTQEKPKHRHDKAGPKSGVGQDTRGNEKVVNAMDKAEDMEQGFDYKDQHDTKHHKEKKVLGFAFLVCFWGIFCSYFVYGLLQERMYVLMLSLCTAQCINPPPPPPPPPFLYTFSLVYVVQNKVSTGSASIIFSFWWPYSVSWMLLLRGLVS